MLPTGICSIGVSPVNRGEIVWGIAAKEATVRGFVWEGRSCMNCLISGYSSGHGCGGDWVRVGCVTSRAPSLFNRLAFISLSMQSRHLSFVVRWHRWRCGLFLCRVCLREHCIPSQGSVMSLCVWFARSASVMFVRGGGCGFGPDREAIGAELASARAFVLMEFLYGCHTLFSCVITCAVRALASSLWSVACVCVLMKLARFAGARPARRSC